MHAYRGRPVALHVLMNRQAAVPCFSSGCLCIAIPPPSWPASEAMQDCNVRLLRPSPRPWQHESMAYCLQAAAAALEAGSSSGIESLAVALPPQAGNGVRVRVSTRPVETDEKPWPAA